VDGEVENSVNARWGSTVESADIRWLDAQLALETGELLEPPWPEPDLPRAARKWFWESYSPELTLTMATDIMRDALIGYRELVELNFPSFGLALGLYSFLPARIEGLLTRFEGDNQERRLRVMFELIEDRSAERNAPPTVELGLVTSRADETLYSFARERRRAPNSVFGPPRLEDRGFDIHGARPATNLAYEWLARDLKALGWVNADVHYTT
jgi:hypothetical protein